MSTSLRASRKGNILLFKLDDPTGYPRLERGVLEELAHQLGAVSREVALEGIVITGTEWAFAAGADLAEVSALTPVEALRFAELGQKVLRQIEAFPRPIVAAIRGYCFGGGLDIAMACHLRVASNDAQFSHPGSSLGIITGWGGTQRLARIAGAARTLELLITGRAIAADEARRLGLVNRVVPPERVVEAAVQLAHACGNSKPGLSP